MTPGRRVRPTIVALLVLLGSAPAYPWGAAGHMVVTEIAYQRLEPGTRAEVDRLVALLADFEPHRRSAVTASLWMDDVRALGWRSFDRKHYVNLPFNADGLPSVPGVDTDNAIDAVHRAVGTLENADAPDLAKAVELRLLLHLVGDLHQPLHTISRITTEHPEGDRGGNDFPLLDLEGRPSNLHRLWDGTVGLLPPLVGKSDGESAEEPSEALKEELKQVRSLAAEIAGAVPDDTLPEWRDLDPETWAREGFQLATSVVYVGIAEGRPPSEVYQAKSRLVVRRRLALAGYRLGALLDSVLARPSLRRP